VSKIERQQERVWQMSSSLFEEKDPKFHEDEKRQEDPDSFQVRKEFATCFFEIQKCLGIEVHEVMSLT
jgi:hypothetical protein